MTDPRRLITDAVYYWPQFTTVAEPLDVELAVFSLYGAWLMNLTDPPRA